MGKIRIIYQQLLNLLGAAGGLIIAGIAVGVTLDVVLRNIGISSFSWIIETAEYGLYVSTFLAAPWVLSKSGHVQVDLVVNGVPRPIAFLLKVCADIVGFVICIVLFWAGFTVTLEAARIGSMIIKELVVVEWHLLIFIPFAFILMSIEFSRRIGRSLSGRDFLAIDDNS